MIADSKRGFTLIEVLIYSALLAVFFGAAIFVLNNILDSSGDISQKVELLAAQEFIERKLSWAMSTASDISEPLPGATGTSTKIILNDGSATSLLFVLKNNNLNLSTNSGPEVPLNNQRIKVNNFSTSHFVSSSSVHSLKISLEVETTFRGSRKSSSTYFYVLQR